MTAIVVFKGLLLALAAAVLAVLVLAGTDKHRRK